MKSQKENSKGPQPVRRVHRRVASAQEAEAIERALDRLLAEWVRQELVRGGSKK